MEPRPHPTTGPGEPAPVTVLVVRPRRQADDWLAELAALGVAASALPLIGIRPAPDPGAIRAALRDAIDCPVLEPVFVFVSPNAVEGFFSAAAGAIEAPAPATWPSSAFAAATGPGTVAALRRAGIAPERIVAPREDEATFDSEALWRRIGGWNWPGRRVWIVRGNGGRNWLGDQLRAAGAEVDVVQSYERTLPGLTPDEVGLLRRAVGEPSRWLWVFSSSEAIGNLEILAPATDWSAARALASHPRIAARARTLGFGSVVEIAPTPVAVAAAARAGTGG